MSATWAEANQRYTAASLRRITAFLGEGPSAEVAGIDAELRTFAATMERPPAIVALADAFGLSPFERDTLLLCAGVELDDTVRRALADGRGDHAAHTAPTFGLALAVLPGAHWSALTPSSPLRRWQFVEPGAGSTLTAAPLLASERVVHYLAGVHYVDESASLRPFEGVVELPAGQAEVARAAVAGLSERSAQRPLAIQLTGRLRAALAVAANIATEFGLRAASLRAEDVPVTAADRNTLARRIEREAVLAGLLPVFDCTGAERDSLRVAARLADEVSGPIIVIAPGPLELSRADIRFAVPATTANERSGAWRSALGPTATPPGDTIDRVAELFDLDHAAIATAAAEFRSRASGEDSAPATLWQLARERARPRLEHLAERVESTAGWDQLVLPAAQLQLVREIAVHARWRGRVYRDWAFGAQGAPGLGISALFSGPSGTGKTMTAGVIARELGLDLYRIDLSRVVSKYIGETEKNLGTVFDEAEGAGAILLFDEADALFGKRSEVRDSHDRYANLEVSYLLQRMEAYNGLAILTTNQRSALDPAFLRRIRFALQFPFPDVAARTEIWRRVFPSQAPTEALDFDLLGRLNVAGGNIRNMAVNAAFHAAAAGAPVRMEHILLSARAEYAKLERPLPESEVRGWT